MISFICGCEKCLLSSSSDKFMPHLSRSLRSIRRHRTHLLHAKNHSLKVARRLFCYVWTRSINELVSQLAKISLSPPSIPLNAPCVQTPQEALKVFPNSLHPPLDPLQPPRLSDYPTLPFVRPDRANPYSKLNFADRQDSGPVERS